MGAFQPFVVGNCLEFLPDVGNSMNRLPKSDRMRELLTSLIGAFRVRVWTTSFAEVQICFFTITVGILVHFISR